jgi:hypothetical protein
MVQSMQNTGLTFSRGDWGFGVHDRYDARIVGRPRGSAAPVRGRWRRADDGSRARHLRAARGRATRTSDDRWACRRSDDGRSDDSSSSRAAEVWDGRGGCGWCCRVCMRARGCGEPRFPTELPVLGSRGSNYLRAPADQVEGALPGLRGRRAGDATACVS